MWIFHTEQMENFTRMPYKLETWFNVPWRFFYKYFKFQRLFKKISVYLKNRIILLKMKFLVMFQGFSIHSPSDILFFTGKEFFIFSNHFFSAWLFLKPQRLKTQKLAVDIFINKSSSLERLRILHKKALLEGYTTNTRVQY